LRTGLSPSLSNSTKTRVFESLCICDVIMLMPADKEKDGDRIK
jgi:hypothetical protein